MQKNLKFIEQKNILKATDSLSSKLDLTSSLLCQSLCFPISRSQKSVNENEDDHIKV